MDTYNEVSADNYKEGEVYTMMTRLLAADPTHARPWPGEIEDLIERGILAHTKDAVKNIAHPTSGKIGIRMSNVFLTEKGKSLAKDILYVRSHPELNISRPKE
jgi:hypothetical protein